MNQVAQPLPAPKKKFPTWAIVLLVLAGAGCLIVPVLASLAIFGVRKYIANAKTAEARNALGQIAKDTATAYEDTGSGARRLCASASAPVPLSVSSIKGVKYQSAPEEWHVDKATHAGFYCLKFEMSMPQYYQYNYAAHGASSAGSGFVATARGDLNGDGVTSEFTVGGEVSAGGLLSVAPTLTEKNPEE